MPTGFTKPPIKPAWAFDATEPDIYEPNDAVKASGWTATNPAPPYQWENWLHNYAMKAVRYLSGNGIPAYDAVEEYAVGDVVQYGTPSKTYQCVAATPGNTVPTNASFWEVYGVSWLPDALKASLAASLPALMLAAMKTLLGINLTADITGGTFDCGGLRIGWLNDALGKSNGNVTTSTFTWSAAFENVFGAVAMPYGADVVLSVSAFDTSTCTITPFGQAANCTVFVVGLGTTPT